MTITIQDMVSRELYYCVSGLVHTLACGFGYEAQDFDGSGNAKNLAELNEKAFYLSTPIDDWGRGERVDKDFAGITIWARTTTGQAIDCDYVIGQIYGELVK